MQTPSSRFKGEEQIGLSWILADVGGTRIVAHGGQTNGQVSAFWFCPHEGIAFTSLTNASNGRRVNQDLTQYAQELFLDYRAPDIEPIPVSNLEDYTGVYRGEPNHDYYEVLVDGEDVVFREVDAGRLAESFDRPDEATPSAFQFTGSDEFRLEGGDNHGSVGEFWRDHEGQVCHMRTSRLLIKES